LKRSARAVRFFRLAKGMAAGRRASRIDRAARAMDGAKRGNSPPRQGSAGLPGKKWGFMGDLRQMPDPYLKHFFLAGKPVP